MFLILSKISKIDIYFKGKNRDIYGHPYHAFIIKIRFSYVSYFRTVSIVMPFAYGDGGKYDVRMWTGAALHEFFGSDFSFSDYARYLSFYYKHARKDEELKNPDKWKTDAHGWEDITNEII